MRSQGALLTHHSTCWRHKSWGPGCLLGAPTAPTQGQGPVIGGLFLVGDLPSSFPQGDGPCHALKTELG